MKAVVATKYGGPDVLAIVERPSPAVGPRDVLIDVRAASINPLDAKLRAGKVKLVLPLKPPIALGCDVAGVVAACGADAKKFAVGDEVFARLEKLRMGGLAQQVAADESVVAKKPTSISFEEAASLPLVALTSWQALHDLAKVSDGERVAITAGAGGVGTIAIQIAKMRRLRVATTTSTKNIEFVKSLGADEVIDYTKQSLDDKPYEYSAVFDSLGGDSELQAIRATRRGGVVVGIGGIPDGEFAKEWMPGWSRPAIWLMTRKRRSAARRGNVQFRYLFMRPDGEQLAMIAAAVDAGMLRPVIHKTYPLDDIKEAFAELERGKSRGKIVVTI
ncbi:MAG TPA: NADP-dependent oxidoreductase [Kofleriaceae bacterium]|jgi:NADPH:quinone reductase-like Zn-dependent oxidoreductase